MASADQIMPVGDSQPREQDPERGTMKPMEIIDPSVPEQQTSVLERIEATLPGSTRIQKWSFVAILTALLLALIAYIVKCAQTSKPPCPDGYVEITARRLMDNNSNSVVPQDCMQDSSSFDHSKQLKSDLVVEVFDSAEGSKNDSKSLEEHNSNQQPSSLLVEVSSLKPSTVIMYDSQNKERSSFVQEQGNSDQQKSILLLNEVSSPSATTIKYDSKHAENGSPFQGEGNSIQQKSDSLIEASSDAFNHQESSVHTIEDVHFMEDDNFLSSVQESSHTLGQNAMVHGSSTGTGDHQDTSDLLKIGDDEVLGEDLKGSPDVSPVSKIIQEASNADPKVSKVGHTSNVLLHIDDVEDRSQEASNAGPKMSKVDHVSSELLNIDDAEVFDNFRAVKEDLSNIQDPPQSRKSGPWLNGMAAAHQTMSHKDPFVLLSPRGSNSRQTPAVKESNNFQQPFGSTFGKINFQKLEQRSKVPFPYGLAQPSASPRQQDKTQGSKANVAFPYPGGSTQPSALSSSQQQDKTQGRFKLNTNNPFGQEDFSYDNQN